MGTYNDSANVGHGFLLNGGHYTTLDDPNATFGGTTPTAINNFGLIPGYYFGPTQEAHGFLYSHGTYVPLDDPNASPVCLDSVSVPGTTPSGVNDLGRVVGTYADLNGVYHGFVYSHGTFTTLDAPGAGTFADGLQGTTLTGINDRGQIAGFYFDASDTGHAFVYSIGQFTPIPDGEPNYIYPTGINNLGQVVGVYNDPTTFAFHSFFYSGGNLTSLDDPAAGTQATYVNGINDFGWAVGYEFGSNATHGLLITPAFSGSGGGGLNAGARPVTQPLNGASLVAALTAHDGGLSAGPLGSAVTVGGARSDGLFATSATAVNTAAVSGPVQTRTEAATARLVDHALSAGSLDPAAFALDSFALLAGHQGGEVLA